MMLAIMPQADLSRILPLINVSICMFLIEITVTWFCPFFLYKTWRLVVFLLLRFLMRLLFYMLCPIKTFPYVIGDL